MRKLLLTMALTLPCFMMAEMDIKEGINVSGKISAVRNTAKYASVQKCQVYAESRDKIVAFTYNSKKRECTLYKSVRSLSKEPNTTSGLI
jgi:hypothetical protein|tara:strand:+ start:533 stop:802 length:270 start_codon:yes stop_codon:yes gene_type:complete